MTATATENVMKLCKLMRKQDAPDTQPVLVQLNDLEEVASKASLWDKFFDAMDSDMMKNYDKIVMLDDFLKELRNL